jgi:hypothetical protein
MLEMVAPQTISFPAEPHYTLLVARFQLPTSRRARRTIHEVDLLFNFPHLVLSLRQTTTRTVLLLDETRQ